METPSTTELAFKIYLESDVTAEQIIKKLFITNPAAVVAAMWDENTKVPISPELGKYLCAIWATEGKVFAIKAARTTLNIGLKEAMTLTEDALAKYGYSIVPFNVMNKFKSKDRDAALAYLSGKLTSIYKGIYSESALIVAKSILKESANG